MSKLRLDYFLSLGLTLVEGDSVAFGCFDYEFEDEHSICILNIPSELNKERCITSFAPRKNTGKQPVGGNIPIIANYDNDSEYKNLIKNISFEYIDAPCAKNMLSWEPDIEALVKMQDVHDEQLRYACCSACNHEWKEQKGVDVNSVPCPNCGDRIPKPSEPIKHEWQNGDEVALELKAIGIVVGKHPVKDDRIIVWHYEGKRCKEYQQYLLVKPESGEAKASREREQKAEALYELHNKCTVQKLEGDWCRLNRTVKEGYRKMIDAGVNINEQ